MITKVNIEQATSKPKSVKFGDLHIGDYFKMSDYPDIYLTLSLGETRNAYNLSEHRITTFRLNYDVIPITSINISYEI